MEEMVKNRKFRITKRIDAGNVFNKLAALGEAYHSFFRFPDINWMVTTMQLWA